MFTQTHILTAPEYLWGTISRALPKLRTVTVLSLAIGVGSIIWQLPAPFPLDERGMHFLATLATAVLLWIFEVLDDYLVSLILLLSWLVAGVVPTEVALAGFSKGSWFFVVGALGIGAAVNSSGILNTLAVRLLHTIRVDHKLYNLIFAASGWLITPLVPEVKGRIVLITPLARAISERIGFASRSNGSASLTLSGYVGVSQLTFMFLTGSTYCLVGWSLLPEAAKVEFDWVTWAVAALPAGVVFIVLLYLSVLFFFPVKETAVADRSAETGTAPNDDLSPLTGKQWLSVSIVGLALIGWITKPLHQVGEAWIAFAALLAFLATEVLDRKTFKTQVDWPIIMFFGVVYGMGGICAYLRVDDWLSQVLKLVFFAISSQPTMFLLVTLLFVYFIRFFLVKSPAVILAMLVLLPVANDLGIHPGVLLITILLGIETWIFPYQNPSYLLAYSSTEGKAFSHTQGRTLMMVKFVVSIVALLVSIPYWKMLGLIN